ncbi:MAG: hypothetical protein ACI8PB_003697 [Desulforhopalus sp.]|jgi:hypothetical protein
MKKIMLFFFIIFLTATFSNVANAGSPLSTYCDLKEVKSDLRPGASSQPTIVTVGLRLIDVTAIEDTSQTITADFMVTQDWIDPDLAGYEGCQFSLDEVWSPQINVLNSGRLFKKFDDFVNVFEAGRVRLTQRYRGSLVFVYDAHRFPFDTQNIVVSLLSEKNDQNKVKIIINESVTGRNPAAFNIPDWSITDVSAQVVTKHFEIGNSSHSSFEFSIPAKRLSGYYTWKVIVPLMLIVFMSWTVFWINPSQVGPQISMSATSMLTLIAFQFAMGDIQPRLTYFTVMDRFIFGSTVLVFLALLESVATNYLVNKNAEARALQMDRHCCWIFPTVFFVFVGIVFYH